MIKRLMALDGVAAICQFRDDGAFVEGYGVMPAQHLEALAKFAHDYKRIVQGNADQLSMFTQLRGWTPPGGWIVRSDEMSVCSVGNLVCLLQNDSASLSEVMRALQEASHW